MSIILSSGKGFTPDKSDDTVNRMMALLYLYERYRKFEFSVHRQDTLKRKRGEYWSFVGQYFKTRTDASFASLYHQVTFVTPLAVFGGMAIGILDLVQYI